MLFLQKALGKYPVGATRFIAPVETAKIFGDVKVRTEKGVVPVLSLEEVAFTVFYPARLEGARYGIDWIPRPLRYFVYGTANFGRVPNWVVWPAIALLGQFFKIPVYHNAPLLEPSKDESSDANDTKPQWPLVIFSHGLGGNANTYSQICTRMAASGKVVLAMEHSDGTAPAVVDSRGNPRVYAHQDDVIYSEGTDLTGPRWLPLRMEQLVYRRHEVYRAYAAFSQFVKGRSGDAENAFKLLAVNDGGEVDSVTWLEAVNCDEKVALVAHSFGGATLFSILSNPPPDPSYPTLPLTHAVAFDPWIEPIPSPGPVPYVPLRSETQHSSAQSSTTLDVSPNAGLNEVRDKLARNASQPQLLVINGEGFTLWEEHFQRLETVMRTWEPRGRRLLTIVRAFHSYFSDVHLIPVRRRFDPTAAPIMDVVTKLTLDFIDGQGDDYLKDVRTREFKVEEYKALGKTKTRLVGDVADVVVH